MLTLRDYQVEAVEAVETAWADGIDRPAVVLPTGTGKTVLFASLAARAGRAVIIVHRDELIRQTVAKIRAVAGVEAGIVKAGQDETGADIIVASVQTLASPDRLARIRPAAEHGDITIIDEAHHATARTYRAVLDHRGGRAVGLTATMERGDGIALGQVWQKIVYQRGIIEMIRSGHLADVTGHRLEVPELDLADVPMRHGDFSDAGLGRALAKSPAPELVARAYVEDYAGVPAILFAPTVDSARLFGEALAEHGVRTAMVWGMQPIDERRAALADFEAGRLDVLCNCMVLTEGFDSPRATLAVLARPTTSAPLFIQMVGRILRPYPGKAKASVLDVVGVTGAHELATLARLGGLRLPPPPGQSLLEAWGLEEEHREEVARQYADGKGQLFEVDLFGGARQRWLQTKAGVWFMSGAERYVALHPDGEGGWDVASWGSRRGGHWIARALPDLELAMSVGESDITPDEEVFAGKARAWHKRKASDKQLGLLSSLTRLDVTTWTGMRAGAVGNLISIELASRRIDPMMARQGRERITS